DRLNLITLQDWVVEHDLYRAVFKFDLIGTESGNVTLAANDQISLTIDNTKLYYPGNDNVVYFYYDSFAKKWSAYVNENSNDQLNITDTDPVMKPRIETRYASVDQGIVVKSIESQYYKRINDQTDFEKYKSLILSYKLKESHADAINLDSKDSILKPINAFAQVSADVDVIYSFHDDMLEDNVFSYNLNPIFTTNSYDNLGNYLINEAGFIPRDSTALKYFNVSSTSGNNYTPEYNNISQFFEFLDNEDSGYYEVTTTGYDKRENPRINEIDA
ncbi:unnamed protein product, partial [marine sediment metagenome]